MSRLERMNDWCGKVLNKAIRYDDLITFSFFAIMLTLLFKLILYPLIEAAPALLATFTVPFAA